MPHPSDDHALVPKPPPPRPDRRDAAIEAALRRFDGAEAPAPEPAKARSSWIGRPQLAWAMTACLVAVIGLPTAFIVMRDGNSPVFQAPPQSPATQAQRERVVQDDAVPEAPPVQPPVASVPTVPTAIAPAQKQQEGATGVANKPADQLAAAERETIGYAAAPPPPPLPPPPPPPPSPAPAIAQKSAEATGTNEVVITGSLLRAPLTARETSSDAPAIRGVVSKDRSYAVFLTRLQAAVRANDRRGVTKLIQFPLRVNADAQPRFYPDARSVRRDYERIFTPRVRRAILDQRAESLFGRDQGVMIGDGQVWFDHICANAQCSPPGPVRIKAVNL